MSLLPLVYKTLLASSSVVDLVDDRVYRHGEAPEGVVAPYVTWFIVTAPAENVLDGRPPVDRHELQVDIWSNNDGGGDDGVEAVAEVVRDVLEEEHHVNGIIINGRDPETKRYRIGFSVTFFVHREAVGDLGFPQSV